MPRRFMQELSRDLTQLLESEYDYNLIIEVGSPPNIRQIKAHSAILYQRSSYFRQILESATKQNNITEIKLPHLEPNLFDIIIKYIYGGVMVLDNMTISNKFGLLSISSEFKIHRLVKYIQANIIRQKKSWLQSSFSHAYQMILQNDEFKDLKQFCNNALIKRSSLIFESDDFDTLHEDILILILNRDDLRTDESKVWDKIILWGKARIPNLPTNVGLWTDLNFKSLKTTLRNLLPLIKYSHISNEDIMIKVYPYKNILENNVWTAILRKCVTPILNANSPAVLPPPPKRIKRQSPIDEVLPLLHKRVKPQSPVDAVLLLPPTREKMQSLIGQTSWFSFNSIITLQHIAVISSWIDRHSTTYDITDIPYKFILLFKGNKDGFSENTFHKLCDNIHGTMVVAKVSGTKELLGGYNPLIWKANESRTDCSAQTADSFIFSLQSNNSDETIISRVKNRKNAIYYGTERNGPGFGRGDLRMGSNRNASFWYCKQEDYETPIRKISESEWFTVDEFEVFQVRRLVTN